MHIPKTKWLSHNALTIYAVLLGIAFGYLNHEAVNSLAVIISDIAIRLMKLVAMPLLFLSLVSSASHFNSFGEVKVLGIKIVKYTLLTTFIAALVAEALYLVFSPNFLGAKAYPHDRPPGIDQGFLNTILNMFPDNVMGAFLDNNVLAVVLMAILLAVALLNVKEKDIVFSFFGGLLHAIMKIVSVGLRFLPVAVWAFVTILVKQIVTEKTDSFSAISGLTITVIAANIIQGIIVLPLLLRLKGINPKILFSHVKEALIVAFFTRSSMATLPVTLDRAINHARINEDIAKLSLPLCTTINMNGCAQFILMSVYFVCAYTGHPLSTFDHIGMIFLSVLAAIGNAGVPMGCFFLASSILASKDIPLYLMGSILPLYTFIDMVETALNVWSDISITKIVDKETKTATIHI
jgi:Na+/H+-dicarboxylate symporter